MSASRSRDAEEQAWFQQWKAERADDGKNITEGRKPTAGRALTDSQAPSVPEIPPF